ncbi:MAG: ROK family protein [Actinomycetota bacterium]|nr:ROK family protein [Actinomycetota bacterium]
MSRDIQPQCLIGVDVGGTKTLALLVELAPGLPPRVVDRELVPSEAGSDESIEQIERAVEAILDRATTRPSAIGVGLAGFVDRHGIVRSAPNSAGLIGIDVAARLEERFGVPAVVDNDANCVAVATHALAEPDAQSLVAITLGTGIGGGIVIGHRLLRGANGFAGEPGHMVIERGGVLCPCGQRGCWEVYASGSGLERLAREAIEAGEAEGLREAAGSAAALRGEHVTDRLSDGDPEALAIFERYAGYVAVGLANLLVLLDPQVIVIGGGVSRHGALLLELITRELDDGYPSAVAGRSTRILVAPDGPDAGAIGAAVLGAQRLASHESVAGHGGPGE